jgi:pimeloyl-ACP methyl ester carboxylesterase
LQICETHDWPQQGSAVQTQAMSRSSPILSRRGLLAAGVIAGAGAAAVSRAEAPPAPSAGRLERLTGRRDSADLVVFIPGSGCEDPARQMERLFADAEADWLVTARPKRGVASGASGLFPCSDGFEQGAVYPRLIADNTAFAAEVLGAPQPGGRRILLGYSEGGTVAPFVAAAAGGFTHLVVLAAGALRGEDELRLTLARSGRDGPAVDRTLAAIRAAPDDESSVVLGETYRYWASMLAIDPMQAYARLSLPILMIHGDRDTIVPVEGTLHARDQFAALGKTNLAVEILAGAGHGLGLGARQGRIRLWTRVSRWLASTTA